MPYTTQYKEKTIPVSLFFSAHVPVPFAYPPAVSSLLALSLTAVFS
jgi:hypothetical protein